MKVQLRESIYTTVFGDTITESCESCIFFAQDECTAFVPIYKLCPPPGKVFRYADKSPEVFDL